MYFCPQCNYSFDISKLSSTESKKILSTPEDVIKRFRAGKDLSNYSVNFEKNELFKHKKIGKLSSDDKNKLNVLFEKNNDFNRIEFKCVNCNFRKPINNSIKLYEIDFVDDNVSKFKSTNENKLLFNNPIYPRTKDYTCKNMNCITHKDATNKEAVFYKDKKTNLLVYICGVCYTNWG
tara:strand:+ start:4457 stop:4990 length:534 start_codon:yes stop_codon:yes gene_type:complete